jgi:hypothetical protein
LKFVIAALTMMVLLIPAFGQTTAEEWFDKGVALMNQSKYGEVAYYSVVYGRETDSGT